jgi:hypothetical protein
VLTGHSVDNLSPDTPPFLVAQRDGADVVLKWNRSRAADLRNYVVYRSGDRGVATVPDDLLGSSVDTTFVDANAPERALRYVVVAADVHGNRSATSNSAAVAPAGGTHAAPSLTHLVVLQNRPNPFQGSTEMEIGLPSASRVEILVFDVAGRRVRAQALSRVNAGWQKIAFDGRNDAGAPLPSGVYFYRVTAGASTFTRKLVIAR